jgi:hypothetical protein
MGILTIQNHDTIDNGDISGYMVLRPDEIATLLEWDLDWVFNSPTFQVVELLWCSPAQRLQETSGPEVCCRGSVFDATAQAFTKAFYRVADAQFGVPEFFIPWSHEKRALAPWIWFGKAFTEYNCPTISKYPIFWSDCYELLSVSW